MSDRAVAIRFLAFAGFLLFSTSLGQAQTVAEGTLQADGYAGFDPIYAAGHIQEAACWAHVRRKFYDLEVAHKSPVATEALQRIAVLYAIEKEIRGRPPDERREVRNTRSRPLLESLKHG